MPWRCFFVKDTDIAQRRLRRYKDSDEEKCPVHGYHTASVDIEREPVVRREDRYIEWLDPTLFDGDERWPTHCDCGYEFQPGDHWQVVQREIYRAEDGREWAGVESLPPGAMYDAWWDLRAKPGPDGLRLAVALPPEGGHHSWCIDGPSSGGGFWTRTGTMPNISASPSILTDRYHGFLQNGMLTDSLSDRPLPPGPDAG